MFRWLRRRGREAHCRGSGRAAWEQAGWAARSESHRDGSVLQKAVSGDKISASPRPPNGESRFKAGRTHEELHHAMMAGEFPAGYPAQARRLAAGVEPRAAARL